MSHELEHHESRMLHHGTAHRALLSELEFILDTPRLRGGIGPDPVGFVARFIDLPRIMRLVARVVPGPELKIFSEGKDGGA